MITKAIGIKSAEVREDPIGIPGSRILRIVTETGGEIVINVTVAEIRRLTQVLATTDLPPFKHSVKCSKVPTVDATGFQLRNGQQLGKASLPHRS